MADDLRSPSPADALRDVHATVRSELEQEYSKRLLDTRRQVRMEQDRADAERICAVRETMGVRMAEYRRGKLSHIFAIGASGIAGFTFGYLAQRGADVRVKGVPVLALGGVPGVVLGAAFDESMALRASLVVGGSMFTVGTATYALTHPEPPIAGPPVLAGVDPAPPKGNVP